MLRAWLELARISNLPSAWTNVTAAWVLAGGSLADGRLWLLWLASTTFYGGGMILNDAADVAFDREHRPERPIPSGRVRLTTAWAVGLLALVTGWAVAVFGAGSSAIVAAGLVGLILAYDLYHKPWSGAVVVMGGCRWFLYLTAGSVLLNAGEDLWQGEVGLRGIALGAYIVGLTMVARQEASLDRVPAGTQLMAKALLYAPGLLTAWDYMQGGGWEGLLVLPFFAVMTWHAGRLMRRGGPSIGEAVGVLLAGIAIVDGLAVAAESLPLAFGFVAAMPVLRLWQRKIAAT